MPAGQAVAVHVPLDYHNALISVRALGTSTWSPPTPLWEIDHEEEDCDMLALSESCDATANPTSFFFTSRGTLPLRKSTRVGPLNTAHQSYFHTCRFPRVLLSKNFPLWFQVSFYVDAWLVDLSYTHGLVFGHSGGPNDAKQLPSLSVRASTPTVLEALTALCFDTSPMLRTLLDAHPASLLDSIPVVMCSASEVRVKASASAHNVWSDPCKFRAPGTADLLELTDVSAVAPRQVTMPLELVVSTFALPRSTRAPSLAMSAAAPAPVNLAATVHVMPHATWTVPPTQVVVFSPACIILNKTRTSLWVKQRGRADDLITLVKADAFQIWNWPDPTASELAWAFRVADSGAFVLPWSHNMSCAIVCPFLTVYISNFNH
jgi:hypothetical protein